jgi:hypothetical protein
MAFSRKHQTDGLLPTSTVHGFRYYKVAAMKELVTPYVPDANPLWDTIPAFGYKVHDYLEWNPSKEEEQKRKAEAVGRTNAWRAKKTNTQRAGDTSRDASQDAYVPDRIERESVRSFPERESDGKPRMQRPGASIAYEAMPEELQERAAWLVGRYGELFQQHRLGAKYRSRPNLDYEDAKTLVPLWNNARLEKLAALVLTTDDPWISRTDRSFKIFTMKASWADDKLRAWEIENGVAV